MPLEVTREPAMMADPANRALDDPPLGQDDEAMLIATADDLHLPWPGARHGGGHFRSLIACIPDDPFEEGELPSSLAQQRFGSVAVLYVGGMHHDAQQQAERVRQDVALAAKGLLARIVTRRVERRPPFEPPSRSGCR